MLLDIIKALIQWPTVFHKVFRASFPVVLSNYGHDDFSIRLLSSDRPKLQFQVSAETDTETETLAETVAETETLRIFLKNAFSTDF